MYGKYRPVRGFYQAFYANVIGSVKSVARSRNLTIRHGLRGLCMAWSNRQAASLVVMRNAIPVKLPAPHKKILEQPARPFQDRFVQDSRARAWQALVWSICPSFDHARSAMAIF
jgi:hypothetical protein